jgi:hypothetical protein
MCTSTTSIPSCVTKDTRAGRDRTSFCLQPPAVWSEPLRQETPTLRLKGWLKRGSTLKFQSGHCGSDLVSRDSQTFAPRCQNQKKTHCGAFLRQWVGITLIRAAQVLYAAPLHVGAKILRQQQNATRWSSSDMQTKGIFQVNACQEKSASQILAN